ncbi:MAG: hypothetical protein HY893_00265 [Deltaproteobacteria bacterium]|nr:hypothetical protein [Deltaproteobacteria bacterium]
MPEVLIDGKRLDFEDTEGDSTLGDLLRAVESELKAIRRFIADIRLDGQSSGDWRTGGRFRSPLYGFSEISIETGSVDAAALEGLDTVTEYFKVIKGEISACVRDSRLGGPGADKSFNTVFEGLVEIVKTIEALAGCADAFEIKLFSENPENFYLPLLKNLEALKDARTAGDPVLVADMLEYELTPFLNGMESRIFRCPEA